MHCYSPQLGCETGTQYQFKFDLLVRLFLGCFVCFLFWAIGGIEVHCLETESGNQSFKESKCLGFCNSREPPAAASFCCYRTNAACMLVPNIAFLVNTQI